MTGYDKWTTDIQYHEGLTERAVGIFGDIVKGAYITNYHPVDDDLDLEVWGTLDKEQTRMDANLSGSEKDEIVFDSQCLWIEFVSGKVVEIQNSEWGIIRKVKAWEAV